MPVPLHVHSHFSLLRGASSPEALARRAAELGYAALALTDRDATYGAVQFAKACREAGVGAILGCELTLEDGSHLTLLAESQRGYANLCRLVTLGRRDQPKGESLVPFDALAGHTAGLLALSGPRTGALARLLLAKRRTEAAEAARGYRDLFGDRFYVELQHHWLPDDGWLTGELAALGRACGIPLVATTDVHYAAPEGRVLQDLLTCIRTKTTMARPSGERLPNGRFHLPSPDDFQKRFRREPEALARTDAIAARCADVVTLDYRAARPPAPGLPEGETADDALRRLCLEGLRARYRPVTERARGQLEHELAVVREAGLAASFLVAADVARRFRGRCRGSAAGSIILYCLGVASADPLRYGMLFERFVNPERPTPPDIDVDFAEWDREAAIAHVYARYGREHAAMVCNYVRYRPRLAVRDVGRALDLPAELVDRLAKSLDHNADDLADGIAAFARAHEGAAGMPELWRLLARLCRELDDTPRHLSIHVGGMVLAREPLVELFGLEPARKEGIVVVGGDKEDVEDVGLGKLDLLCLRAMSVVQEAEALERARGVPLDLRAIDLEDPEVYRMLRRADTIGASQVESRAQMQSVVRTRPACFVDLINQCAIIRPGPITAGMVHPFNRRRLGLEPVTYPHPLLRPILRDTYGIFLFQEQVILGVMALTGCTGGEADLFRRAMGSHRSREAMARLRPWFIEQAGERGIGRETAAEVFRQIAGFADFGFCKSHSAALARVAYEGLYLKRYHAPAFAAALLSNQPLGFYPPEVLVWDARRRGVRFQPPDINRSDARCTLEERAGSREPAVRLGLEQVRWVGEELAARVVAERDASGPYASLADVARRTGITGKPAEGLVLSGAFDRLDPRPRSEQLWEVYAWEANRPTVIPAGAGTHRATERKPAAAGWGPGGRWFASEGLLSLVPPTARPMVGGAASDHLTSEGDPVATTEVEAAASDCAPRDPLGAQSEAVSLTTAAAMGHAPGGGHSEAVDTSECASQARSAGACPPPVAASCTPAMAEGTGGGQAPALRKDGDPSPSPPMAVRTAERLLEEPEPAVRFPERTPYERTLLDHHVLGFSLNAHVTDHYQRRLEKIGVVPSASLESGAPDRPVRVGGLVVCRQRPATAKGYMFLTLEDRFGLVNVVVRPDVYARYRDALRNHPLIAVAGRLQRALGATNVLAERALAVDPTIPDDALDDTGAIPSPDTPALAVPAHNFR